MSFENKEAAIYFSIFANTTLDKKHKISESERKKILNEIKKGNVPDNLDNFITALVGCSAIARSKERDKITEEDIERYFLGPHNLHSSCKAYRGIVTKTARGYARIRTDEGENNYKTLISSNLKVGDKVIVHGKYVIRREK